MKKVFFSRSEYNQLIDWPNNSPHLKLKKKNDCPPLWPVSFGSLLDLFSRPTSHSDSISPFCCLEVHTSINIKVYKNACWILHKIKPQDTQRDKGLKMNTKNKYLNYWIYPVLGGGLAFRGNGLWFCKKKHSIWKPQSSKDPLLNCIEKWF